MTTETILPDLIGTLAALPEHTQKTIQAYGAACYRTALQSPEVQALRKEAETEQQLQRAARQLPEGCCVAVEVEKDSGYVGLYFHGDEIVFGEPSDGTADRIKAAISAAMGE